MSGISVSATKRPPYMPKCPRSSGPVRKELGFCTVIALATFSCADSLAAFRAARINALILSGSFSPGARSTPEETSTPGACVIRRASPTLPASSPPDSMNGTPGEIFQKMPIECLTEAARPGGLAWRARIKDQTIGNRIDAIGQGRHRFNRQCLHHRQTERLLESDDTLRGLLAVKLQHIRIQRVDAGFEPLIVGIDRQRYFLRPAAHALPEHSRDLETQCRGDGGKNTKPTMSAPASSATSSAAGVERPHILIDSDLTINEYGTVSLTGLVRTYDLGRLVLPAATGARFLTRRRPDWSRSSGGPPRECAGMPARLSVSISARKLAPRLDAAGSAAPFALPQPGGDTADDHAADDHARITRTAV